MGFNVSIIADKKLSGFTNYDDGEYINEYASSKSIDEIVSSINKEFKIDSIMNESIEEDYACYDAEANGVCFSINID